MNETSRRWHGPYGQIKVFELTSTVRAAGKQAHRCAPVAVNAQTVPVQGVSFVGFFTIISDSTGYPSAGSNNSTQRRLVYPESYTEVSFHTRRLSFGVLLFLTTQLTG